MEAPKQKISKPVVALWVAAGILVVSCGAYTFFLQDKSNLSTDYAAQEKTVPQSQDDPQTRDNPNTLDSNGTDGSSPSEGQTPPGGMQTPMGGHNMGVPPGAPPLKDVKEL